MKLLSCVSIVNYVRFIQRAGGRLYLTSNKQLLVKGRSLSPLFWRGFR